METVKMVVVFHENVRGVVPIGPKLGALCFQRHRYRYPLKNMQKIRANFSTEVSSFNLARVFRLPLYWTILQLCG